MDPEWLRIYLAKNFSDAARLEIKQLLNNRNLAAPHGYGWRIAACEIQSHNHENQKKRKAIFGKDIEKDHSDCSWLLVIQGGPMDLSEELKRLPKRGGNPWQDIHHMQRQFGSLPPNRQVVGLSQSYNQYPQWGVQPDTRFPVQGQIDSLPNGMQQNVARDAVIPGYENGNAAGFGPKPTYTRMARRYLSIETLNHFRIDYMIDQVSGSRSWWLIPWTLKCNRILSLCLLRDGCQSLNKTYFGLTQKSLGIVENSKGCLLL